MSLLGGPPCQGFSLLNKNREGDPRKQLWRPYFEIVERSGAQVFVMENVPQLLGSFEHGEIMGTAEALGFACWGEVLCAADYGVPQTRRRAFIMGCKFFDPAQVFPPCKTHCAPRKGGAQTSFPQVGGNGYLPRRREVAHSARCDRGSSATEGNSDPRRRPSPRIALRAFPHADECGTVPGHPRRGHEPL